MPQNPKRMLMKQLWYPRPHDQFTSWNMGLEDTSATTIIPIAHYDEGLGAPASYNSHPEHASFAETDDSNCFPDSRINLILSRLNIRLTKLGLETDKIHDVKVGFMPIFMSFKEDYTAIDELSSIEVQDVLELQTESTDRQGGALYAGTKLGENYTNSSLVGSDVPFLTTTQKIEYIVFDINQYYDTLQYRTNAGKLKNCQGGLKWITLTKNRPFATINLKLRSKVKRMNPYTYFGVMVIVPPSGSQYQNPIATDTSAVAQLSASLSTRFYEWHQNFDMEKL